MIVSLLLLIVLIIISYLIIIILQEKKLLWKMNHFIQLKNEKYYDNLLKYYEKTKKIKIKQRLNYFHRVNILIDRCELTRGVFINPVSIFLLGVMSVNIAYIISFRFFEMIVLSMIISIPFFYLPFAVLQYIAEYKEQKVEKIFLNFLLQLKNHTQINNDIILAMREVKIGEPLNGYIKKFLIEINSGIQFEKAIENLKEKIKIEQVRMFLSNLAYCYMYGGSFTELIQKSYQIIGEIQKEKKRRIEETKSARIVLFALIALDILVYVSYIKANMENYIIMRKTVLGNFILYWNFVSIWLLVLLSMKVKKLDY